MESGGRVPQPRVWAGVEAGGEGREGGGELHGIEEGVGGLLGRGGLLVGHGGALHHGHEVGAGVRGPLLLTSGGWCGGGAAVVRESRVSTWLLVRAHWYLFCWPVSPCHPVHVTPLCYHQAGHCLATLPPSLHLCPGCHCLCGLAAVYLCLDAARRAVSR